MTMPRVMNGLAICFFLLTILAAVVNWMPVAITCGTACYHFVMRLAVGHIVDRIMKNRADYTKKWFLPLRWEHAFYKKLKVHTWKKDFPTYNPSLFDTKKHSLSEIVQAMCQAEIVHEIIVLLSFVPLFGSIFFGDFPVFLVTSILSAAFDLCFVIMQRYNRPRILKLMRKLEAGGKT